MSTIHQIEANRLNSKKCTGPRSVGGKARSSMNALKSGIHAQSRVIHGEKAEDLDALTAEYHTRWLPTTPEQRLLVDTLVFNEWLQRRMAVVESQLWEDARHSGYRIEEAVWQGHTFLGRSNVFERLQRRLNAIQRNYRAAVQDLQRLRAEEFAEPQTEDAIGQASQQTLPGPAALPPEPVADPQQNQPASPQIGFVPQPIPQPPAGPPQPTASVLSTARFSPSSPIPAPVFQRSAPPPRAVDVTFSTVLP